MKRVNRHWVMLSMAVLLMLQTQAQLKLKQYWLAGSVVLASGMIDGTIESMTWHYDEGFKRRFPKANNQFWDPSISWTNKYKNHDAAQGQKFIGSTSVLVFTTDGYHMLRTVSRTLNTVTMAFYINQSCHEKQLTSKQKWLRIGRDFLVLTAIRTVGFHLTYSMIFRKPM